jgi:hypothetical protein
MSSVHKPSPDAFVGGKLAGILKIKDMFGQRLQKDYVHPWVCFLKKLHIEKTILLGIRDRTDCF